MENWKRSTTFLVCSLLVAMALGCQTEGTGTNADGHKLGGKADSQTELHRDLGPLTALIEGSIEESSVPDGYTVSLAKGDTITFLLQASYRAELSLYLKGANGQWGDPLISRWVDEDVAAMTFLSWVGQWSFEAAADGEYLVLVSMPYKSPWEVGAEQYELQSTCTVGSCGGLTSVDHPVAPQSDDTEQDGLRVANTYFSNQLLKRVRELGGNVVYAPIGLQMLLLALLPGAKGNTLDQLKDAMGLNQHFVRSRLADDRVHQAFMKLAVTLTQADALVQDYELSLVNGFFWQQDAPLTDAFTATLLLGGSIDLAYPVDFRQDPEGSRQTINNAIKQQSGGLIGELLSDASVNSETRLVLTNVTRFRGAWKTPFDPAATTTGTFRGHYKLDVPVQMMRSIGQYKYIKSDDAGGYKAVELPLQGGDVSLLLIVPNSHMDFQFIAGQETFRSIRAQLQDAQVDVQLPRFTIESSLDVAQRLKEMGVTDAFTPTVADLSGIDGTRDLFLQAIVHKTVFQLDEAGIDAVSGSAVTVSAGSAPPQPDNSIIFDRPFFLVLHHRTTDTDLFVGRITTL